MRTAVAPTSIDAYHGHVNGSLSAGQRADILDFIRRNGGDWSIGELARAMNLQKSTMSARLNELLNMTHELIEAPKRKDRVSGITVRPVKLPQGQMSLI